MLSDFDESWHPFLKKEAKRLQGIHHAIISEKGRVFPPQNQILNAMKLTPLSKVKVLLLGQDPYHGFNQAMGLSFSVPKGVKIPPSLRNIFKELHDDIGCKIPSHGDLGDWAKQGVLLLNATLSVREGEANSHEYLWRDFSDSLISHVSENCDFVVFLLWGNFAKNKSHLIAPRHGVLKTAHPSPLSARYFFGSRHFSKTNELLKSHGKSAINWLLE